jgi:hypothetical protein
MMRAKFFCQLFNYESSYDVTQGPGQEDERVSGFIIASCNSEEGNQRPDGACETTVYDEDTGISKEVDMFVIQHGNDL